MVGLHRTPHTRHVDAPGCSLGTSPPAPPRNGGITLLQKNVKIPATRLNQGHILP